MVDGLELRLGVAATAAAVVVAAAALLTAVVARGANPTDLLSRGVRSMVGREGALGGKVLLWGGGGGKGLGGTGDKGIIFPSCSIHLGGDRRGVVKDRVAAGSSSS